MKAVFVIDVPNELDANNLLIDYCVHTKGEYKTIRKGGNHPLKPLPERWNGELENTHPLSVYSQGMRDGFNMCLEEITE